MVTEHAAGPPGHDLDSSPAAHSPSVSMDPAARAALSQRLSQLPDGMQLPARMEGASTTAQDVQQYLDALLSRDPGVFLERHGKLLVAQELALFEPLRHDYEVNHYLQALLVQTSTSSVPEPDQPSSTLSATTKNRRLALMQRLEQEGSFFTEDSMRERSPLLWQQHVGRYEGERPLPQPAAGAVLSEGLLAAHDEVQLRARLHAEQEAAAAGDDIRGEEAEELQREQGQQERREERVQELLSAMQSRFLAGQEHAEYIDYAQVDADASLDEHWAAQQAQDAEDRWFDAD